MTSIQDTADFHHSFEDILPDNLGDHQIYEFKRPNKTQRYNISQRDRGFALRDDSEDISVEDSDGKLVIKGFSLSNIEKTTFMRIGDKAFMKVEMVTWRDKFKKMKVPFMVDLREMEKEKYEEALLYITTFTVANITVLTNSKDDLERVVRTISHRARGLRIKMLLMNEGVVVEELSFLLKGPSHKVCYPLRVFSELKCNIIQSFTHIVYGDGEVDDEEDEYMKILWERFVKWHILENPPPSRN